MKPKLIENLPKDKMLDIQEELIKKRVPLYLESVNRNFISKKSYCSGLNYLLYKNKVKDTRYANTGKIQCDADRNRSQGDLYMIMRYYYPNITFEEFRVALFKLMNQKKVNSFFCNGIRKRIFFKHEANLRSEDEDNHFLSDLSIVDEFKSTIKYSDGVERDDNFDLYDNDYDDNYEFFANTEYGCWSEDN